MRTLVKSQTLFIGETVDGLTEVSSEIVLEARLWKEMDTEEESSSSHSYVGQVIIGTNYGVSFTGEALTECDNEIIVFGKVYHLDHETTGSFQLNELAELAKPIHDCLVNNSFAIPHSSFGSIPDTIRVVQ